MSKSFSSVEIINKDKLRQILDNWDDISENKFNQDRKPNFDTKLKLINYLKRNISKKNKSKSKIKVDYSYVYGKNKVSRQYVKIYGVQSMQREIRQTITNDYYYDVDIVNSQPSILYNYCLKMGYKCDSLKDYIDNRDKYIESMINKKIFKNRDEAKKEIIKLLNGGVIENHNLQWIENLINEIHEIQNNIMNNPIYKSIINKLNNKKNIKGSIMNNIYCEIENNLLLSCLKFMNLNKISISNLILTFDGFMILKENITDKTSFINNLKQYIKNDTGYDVEYKFKEMNEIIDLSNYFIKKELNNDYLTQKIFCEDDDEAADIIIDKIRDVIHYCNKQIFLKSFSTRCYISNNSEIEEELINIVMNSNIYKGNETKNKPYSGFYSLCKNIAKTIINKIKCSSEFIDNDFQKKIIEYTKGKIFYIDGYIDLENHELIKETTDNTDVITEIRINKKLPNYSEISKNDIDEFYNKILKPIFTNEEIIDCYIKHIGRAIGGYSNDKQWILMTGLRNCGKSIMQMLNKSTFENYVGEISGNNLILELNHTQEDPKKYMFLYDNRLCRILHTSEIKIDDKSKIKIDGNLIKKLQNGGHDEIDCRALYQNSIKVIPNFKLIMLNNDTPEITPADALQTMTKFQLQNKFIQKTEYEEMQKNNELNDFIKIADNNIDIYVNSYKANLVFNYLIFNKFKNNAVINPLIIQQYSMDMKEDYGDDESIIKKYFKFGLNESNISIKDLKLYYSKSNFKMSYSKLKSLLIFYGAKDCRNKQQRFLKCVSIINIEEDEAVFDN
jgi:hypothetical protein